MLIKCHFHVNNICCKHLNPTKDMLGRSTSQMYETNSTEASTDGQDEEILEICNNINF